MNKTFDELKASGDLPSPSGIGMRILQLTQGEDYDTEEIGKTIQADPALTGRILKVANSAQMASVRPCVTVQEATVRLGISSVRNIALGFSLISGNRSGRCEGFDYDEFWSSSLAHGVTAKCLAEITGKFSDAEAFICSLLSGVGRLALAAVHPEEYSTIIDATRGQDATKVAKAEMSAFDITHAEVTSCLMGEWGLPEVYRDAVQEYGDIDLRSHEGTESLDNLCLLLRAGEQLAEGCLIDGESEHVDWQRHWQELQAVREWLGFGEDRFEQLCEQVVASWREWMDILDMEARPTMSIEDIELRASSSVQAAAPEAGAESKPAAQPVEITAPAAQRRTGKLILIADEDLDSMRGVAASLKSAGHRVIGAKTGKQALRLVMEKTPQIVVASCDLPEMDGLRLCQSMRSFDAGSKTYFIAMTDNNDERVFVEAFDAGVDDCVVKPVNAVLLGARIKGAQRILELQERVERDKETMRKHAVQQSVLTRRLRAASLTDVLTELPNRRYAMKRLAQEWDATGRDGSNLSVIMLDIDRFKAVNDTYGHDAGDEVLRQTAGVLREATRKGEDACRLGGEEFLVVLRATDIDGAEKAASRIREMIASNMIHFGDFNGAITASLGVAQREPWMKDVDALIKSADAMVYQAKSSGRNQVCVSTPRDGSGDLKQTG